MFKGFMKLLVQIAGAVEKENKIKMYP